MPTDAKVIDLFDSHEGELLILGEPGSGKTTAMLELARTLLERAEQDPGQPMPVVLNLSTWSEEQSLFADWLVAELNIRYDVPKGIGKRWVEEDRLALLLDGLDEVAEEQRSACVVAINEFRQEHGFTPLVVCSRTAEYEALTTQLNLQTAVRLKPLTADQIDSYLEQLDEDMSNVRTIIREHPTLQELAQSPLMLNIICMAYRDAEAAEVKAAETVDARHRQLFDIYVEKMLARRGEHEEYSAGQTLHWLSWLARSMVAKNQTTFLIERLQPDWLTGAKERATYSWGMRIISGLALAIVLAVTFANRSDSIFSGIVYGFVAGLILLVVWERVPSITLPRLGSLKLGLVEGFTFGLLFWLARMWPYLHLIRDDPDVFAISLLTNFLIPGIFAAAAAGLVSTATIDLVEKLTWSPRSALRRGLPGGLLVGVIFGRFGVIPPSWIGGLLVGLATLGAFGLTWSSDLDKRVDIQPNQGIRRSRNNAILAGSTLGILFGLATGISFYLVDGFGTGLRSGLGYGLAGVLAGGLIFGGYTCLQHVVLRFILYREGVMPKDYVGFLNYATERIFLRRVGAGYVFIHRLLLEHLAGLAAEKSGGTAGQSSDLPG
jgi:DNA polymerase III delta prime subunit